MKTLTALIAAVMLAGCSSSGSNWLPWSRPSDDGKAARTPPGAKGYACEGKKRLLVRFEGDGKSAWVIYPDREFRLDRVVPGSGERFSNGVTTLTVKDGEAALEEGGKVEFAKCKLESAP